jgi:hypothetical protein
MGQWTRSPEGTGRLMNNVLWAIVALLLIAALLVYLGVIKVT